MSIVNPPPNFTREVLRSTVRTFAQGSAAQRAAAAAAASQSASAASIQLLGGSLFAIHISQILTNLSLSLQHSLVQQQATQLQLDQQQRTRSNLQCIFDPSVLTLCPGKGSLSFDEVQDGLQTIRDELDGFYQRMSLVPSLPTWRPFARWWLFEFTRSFNTFEGIIEGGFMCAKNGPKVCRERVMGTKRVCTNSIPLTLEGS